MQEPVVRAIDVGYGHIKFTDGRDPTSRAIHTGSFPSQSPAANGHALDVEIMQRRDTFRVPVGDKVYEVGRQVRLALTGNHETEVLDNHFALSDSYAARLYGALNYMLPNLPGRRIDLLALGLPLTTFETNRRELAKRFTGDHVINTKGDTISIGRVEVFIQPMGSYATYLQSPLPEHKSAPSALVVDPGYNTVDFFACEGMVPNTQMSKAVELGMSKFLRATAKAIIKDKKLPDSEESQVVRMIDQSITSGGPLRLAGNEIQLEQYLAAGDAVIEQAAQAIRNSVGAALNIDVILVTGGGASRYTPWLQKKFPTHRVAVLPNPTTANVRGFHVIAEKLAGSVQRATQGVAAHA